MMTGGNERFRPIETAPEWSHEVFDTCAELADPVELSAAFQTGPAIGEPLLSNTVSTAAPSMDPTCNKR